MQKNSFIVNGRKGKEYLKECMVMDHFYVNFSKWSDQKTLFAMTRAVLGRYVLNLFNISTLLN